MQICAACDHRNAPERGYCAACGHMMRLVCRACRFANDHGDRFCGGCGSSLLTRMHVRSARFPAASATPEELEALFAVKTSPGDEVLPTSGITQDDLDRLFGARVPR